MLRARRVAAVRERAHVVELQERAGVAAPAGRRDERAAAEVAHEDGALHLRGHVARAVRRRGARVRLPRRGELPSRQLRDERAQRALDDGRLVAARVDVPQQVLRAAELLDRGAADRDLQAEPVRRGRAHGRRRQPAQLRRRLLRRHELRDDLLDLRPPLPAGGVQHARRVRRREVRRQQLRGRERQAAVREHGQHGRETARRARRGHRAVRVVLGQGQRVAAIGEQRRVAVGEVEVASLDRVDARHERCGRLAGPACERARPRRQGPIVVPLHVLEDVHSSF